MDRFLPALVGGVGVGRLLDGFSALEGGYVPGEQFEFDGVRVIDIDALPLLRRNVRAVAVVRVLRKDGDILRIDALEDFPYDGRFSRTGSAGNAYDQHGAFG